MVVCTALEQLSRLAKDCGQAVTSIPDVPDAIMSCVHAVMKSECMCMDDGFGGGAGEGLEDDDDEGETEQDELLFEYAGEVMPSLGLAMTPNTFGPFFAGKNFAFSMLKFVVVKNGIFTHFVYYCWL